MAKKFGDVVSLVRNGVPLNALVAQSNVQPDGEHLTVLFLNPTFDSPIIGGSALQQAVATAFAVPFKEGQANGWKEVEGSDTGFVESIMPHLIELSNAVAAADPQADISPDGTLQNATKIVRAIPEMRVNFADAKAANDAEWEKKVEESTADVVKLRGDVEILNQQKLDLLKQLAETRTVRFGVGEVAVVPGQSNDQPAVTLTPVSGAGAVVLEFHGPEGAQVLIQDVAGLFPPKPAGDTGTTA